MNDLPQELEDIILTSELIRKARISIEETASKVEEARCTAWGRPEWRQFALPGVEPGLDSRPIKQWPPGEARALEMSARERRSFHAYVLEHYARQCETLQQRILKAAGK